MYFSKELTKTQGHIYICYTAEKLRILAWSLGTSTRNNVLLCLQSLEAKQFVEVFWKCIAWIIYIWKKRGKSQNFVEKIDYLELFFM